MLTPRDAAARTAELLALVVLALLGAWQAHACWAFYRDAPGLPLWDMAGHGLQAVTLTVDLAHFQLFDFLHELNQQDKWPFGFSLLLLPFVWIGERSFAAATLPSTALFAAFPVLLAWVFAELLRVGGECELPDPDNGRSYGWRRLAVGFAACGFLGLAFLLAPLPRLLSIVIMREMAGIAAVLVALATTLRALRGDQEHRDALNATRGSDTDHVNVEGLSDQRLVRAWLGVGLAALVLFLIKLNFGVLWLLSLGLWMMVEAPSESRRAAFSTFRGWLAPGPRRSWRIAGSVLAGGLAVAALLGVNPGVAVYAVILGATVWLIRRLLRDRAGTLASWRVLSPRARGLSLGLVAPIWVWWLSPDPIHPKELWAFLRNRPGSAFSVEQLLVYPRSLLLDWSPSPAVGLTIVGLALAGVLAWRFGPAFRLVLVATAVHLTLITAHSYREARFLATAVPLLWVTAGVGVWVLAGLWRRRSVDAAAAGVRGPSGWRAWGVALVAGGLAVTLLLPRLSWGGDEAERKERLERDWQNHSGPVELAAGLEMVRQMAPNAGRVGVLGGFNQLSPSLIQWALLRRESAHGLEWTKAPRYPPPRRFDGEGALLQLDSAAARQTLDRWLTAEAPNALVLVQVAADGRFAADLDFRRYNAWQQELVAVASTLPGWQLRGRVDIGDLAVLLMVPAAPAQR